MSSLELLRSDILTEAIHPVRYLLVDGFCHFQQRDTPYSPLISQFPYHFQDLIPDALEAQIHICWDSSMKGYFAKQWGILAQYDMYHPTRNTRQGETRMKQIIRALGAHTRRLWLSRNGVLHSSNDETLAQIRSIEAAEISYYHNRPHLLRTGDQHYCCRPLAKNPGWQTCNATLLATQSEEIIRWINKGRYSSDADYKFFSESLRYRLIYYFSRATAYTVAACRPLHGENPYN